MNSWGRAGLYKLRRAGEKQERTREKKEGESMDELKKEGESMDELNKGSAGRLGGPVAII